MDLLWIDKLIIDMNSSLGDRYCRRRRRRSLSSSVGFRKCST